MSLVKLENGQPTKYPYTVGDFRKDNPNTSFPRQIPVTILRRHNVQPVLELPKPDTEQYEIAARDLMPHKEVIRLKTEEDATNPITRSIRIKSVSPSTGTSGLLVTQCVICLRIQLTRMA